MSSTSSLAAAALLAALAIACAEAPVRRVVRLAAEDGVPTGSTALVGSTLRVELAGLEPLQPGRRLFAWAASSGVWTPLQEVSLGATRLTGPDWESVDELMVTDEGAALGPRPAAMVMFRGRVVGPLPFEGLSGPTFAALQKSDVTLVLENYTLTAASAAPPPSLTSGAFYGVWLLGAGGSTFLGRFDGDETRLTSEVLLADHLEAALTLELENGAETPGPVVLRGKVLTPVILGAAPPETHSH